MKKNVYDFLWHLLLKQKTSVHKELDHKQRALSKEVIQLEFNEVLEKLKSAPRPLTIRFAENSDGVIKMSKWPPGVDLDIIDGNVVITKLNDTAGIATLSGKLPQIGDRLHFVNEVNVEKTQYNEAMEIISATLEKEEPLEMKFSSKDVEGLQTVVFPAGQLGLKFGRSKVGC